MKFLIIFSFAVVLTGCTAKGPEISNTAAPDRNERSRTVLSHGPENQDPATQESIRRAIDNSFVAGFRVVMLIGAVLAVASAATALIFIRAPKRAMPA